MRAQLSTIVCGTDFSDNARHAAEVAAAIASRLAAKLILVHVADEMDEYAAKPRDFRQFARPIELRLREDAGRLEAAGASVESVMLHGKWAGQAMVEYLESRPADLVVVSSVSKTRFERWTMGSVSERIAERSPVPTLVVRSPDSLLEWAQQKRTLNLFVAIDFSTSSDAALAWVAGLRTIGACAITVAHVNWPPEEYRLLAPGKALPLTKNVPAIRRRLVREVQKKIQTWLGDSEAKVHLEPNWGRPDAALVSAAVDAGADLVITGVHQRHGIERIARRSVSRGILRHSPMNVACVPTPADLARAVGRKIEVRRVLAATDFTIAGDQAVAWAYAALPSGGVVRLVHVVPSVDTPDALLARVRAKRPTPAEHRKLVTKAEQKLAALIPPEAAARGIRTEIEVVADREVARAISAEARRFGADMLCLGSQGHGVLAEAVLGSVIKRVMADNSQPVLLVRPPPE